MHVVLFGKYKVKTLWNPRQRPRCINHLRGKPCSAVTQTRKPLPFQVSDSQLNEPGRFAPRRATWERTACFTTDTKAEFYKIGRITSHPEGRAMQHPSQNTRRLCW